MSKLRARPLPFLLTAALVATAGCSHRDPQKAPHASAPAPRYAAVARGRIDVEGGLLHLSAARQGIVAKVLVHAGEHVRQGQPLVQLATGEADAQQMVATGELDQARAQVKLVGVQLKAARQRAQRLATAAAAGADAGQHADDAAQAVQQFLAQRAAAQAAVKIAQGHLQEARRVLDQSVIRAPFEADIVARSVQRGEAVSPASGALLTLLPDAPRIVVAELDTNFVQTVHPGMKAQIVLDNDAESVIGTAHVTRVGKVFGPSKLEDDPALRANTRTVTCTLRFDKPTPLRIGQRVLARILRDQHTVATR